GRGAAGWPADAHDNDQPVPLPSLAGAWERVEPIAPAVFRALATPSPSETAVPLLASALRSMAEPTFLVLDHAEAITNRDCLDIVTELSLSVPAGSQLAIASRPHLPLPTPRLPPPRRVLH